MDPSLLVGLEGLLVVGGVLIFAWWQFRELNRLRREREAREAGKTVAEDETGQR